jgi:hypothetical protein
MGCVMSTSFLRDEALGETKKTLINLCGLIPLCCFNCVITVCVLFAQVCSNFLLLSRILS